MTIFVTWQLILTLDSIRNSCDVFSSSHTLQNHLLLVYEFPLETFLLSVQHKLSSFFGENINRCRNDRSAKSAKQSLARKEADRMWKCRNFYLSPPSSWKILSLAAYHRNQLRKAWLTSDFQKDRSADISSNSNRVDFPLIGFFRPASSGRFWSRQWMQNWYESTFHRFGETFLKQGRKRVFQ